ncbi:aminotransferase class I/II-fold pyridoxal phosphate-dependent enzyme [Pedobacter sp. SD-b]|uniref:Aminotransferase class I/II-fold pyridoxal phosphate-dependent enzyme n=1 Tax=Pedobacter segetis TaxID=2793069 RepID=A0ABS1BNW3_9SPHI|nr:aminotransferase class I/II-fold pyridoxal phosphate-dependent enzyme [Pedobacter segetis]MBK0384011.1 aminotransferase class I/II-fold pyridoxal phosphate-dependent enzyme [Pedobacter segetis]
MKVETKAIHAGNKQDQSTKAAIQPIVLSTTFERGENGDYPGGFMYSRADNPNRKSLENVIAALENGADACAFSSGNAAGMSVFQALEPGSHIIGPDDMYHGLRNQLKLMFKGILTFDFINLTDIELIYNSIKRETKLIWAETPSNPLLKLCDIEALAHIAKEHQLIFAIDNTFASPICQQPLSLGADIVMHSTTKFLNGHSDVSGGVLITKEKDAFWEKIKIVQGYGGAIPAPFDCYMITRGIKTLPYRMRGHVANAQALAEYLENHEAVEAVFYPGLKSHPQHELATKQMLSYGGMLSFLLKDGEEKAKQVVNNLKVFTQATSLGGVESLIEHRYSVEGQDTKTPKNLLRVSVGLEHIDDLMADLESVL